MEALFAKNGTPAFMSSKKIFAVTKLPEAKTEEPKSSFYIGKREFVSWGDNNKRPDDMVRVIGSTGVLSTAVGFKTRTSFGQGVLPMKAEGFLESGERNFVPYNDEWLTDYFDGYTFRNYITQAFRDLFKFGNCFPIFYFNEDGKIASVINRNARHCRVSRDKNYLCVYPDFWKSEPDEKTAEVIEMLNEDDPFLDFERRKAAGKLKNRPLAFPRIKNYYSNNDYYGVPDWDAAWKSGWVDIAHKIPAFLAQSYANAMSLMWHIQVPASFWEKKFPEEQFENPTKRQEAINEFMDSMESSLCGEENVSKALFTDYEASLSGKELDGWKITRLENEIDAKERLSTSAAANSEILFSMMINPSVFGAGMPGGSYAGNSGSGSDIRESFLVSVVTTYIEKQQVLDPVMMFMRDRGYKDLKLKYKDTILTTLNTGQAKEDILS